MELTFRSIPPHYYLALNLNNVSRSRGLCSQAGRRRNQSSTVHYCTVLYTGEASGLDRAAGKTGSPGGALSGAGIVVSEGGAIVVVVSLSVSEIAEERNALKPGAPRDKGAGPWRGGASSSCSGGSMSRTGGSGLREFGFCTVEGKEAGYANSSSTVAERQRTGGQGVQHCTVQ